MESPAKKQNTLDVLTEKEKGGGDFVHFIFKHELPNCIL